MQFNDCVLLWLLLGIIHFIATFMNSKMDDIDEYLKKTNE